MAPPSDNAQNKQPWSCIGSIQLKGIISGISFAPSRTAEKLIVSIAILVQVWCALSCGDRLTSKGKMWQSALCKATQHLESFFLVDLNYARFLTFNIFYLPELKKYSVNHCFNIADNRCRIHYYSVGGPLFKRVIFEVLWKSIIISLCNIRTEAVDSEYCIKNNIIYMSGNNEEKYSLPCLAHGLQIDLCIILNLTNSPSSSHTLLHMQKNSNKIFVVLSYQKVESL